MTGRAPFADAAHAGVPEKLHAHLHESPPPVVQLAPRVPAELVAVVERLMAKQPGDRYATPADAATTLAPFAEGADLARLTEEAAERTPSAVTVGAAGAAADTLPARTQTAPLRRKPWLWATAVGLLLAGLLAGMALGVVITIKRDGKETRVEVPDGAAVRVGEDGQVDVELGPASPDDTRSETVAAEAGQRAAIEKELRDAELAEAELARNYGPQHPKMLAVREHVAMLRTWLKTVDEQAARVDAIDQGRARSTASVVQATRVDAVAEFKALQGRWQVVSVSKGDAADLPEGWPTELDPDTVDRIDIDDDSNVAFLDFDDGRVASFGYKFDPAVAPKAFDLLGGTRGEAAQGIYRLEGPRLEVCFTRYWWQVNAEQRPTDFEIEPGSRDVLFALERYEPPAVEKALAGRWSVAAVIDTNVANDADIRRASVSFDYGTAELRVRAVGIALADKRPILYTVDAEQRPGKIDFVQAVGNKPIRLEGIFELGDDRLKIALRSGGPRPTEFSAERAAGVTLLELRKGEDYWASVDAERKRAAGATGSTGPAAASPSDAAPDELRLPTGEWEVESVEAGTAADLVFEEAMGNFASTPTRIAPRDVERIRIGQLLTVHKKDVEIAFRYQLDPSKSPATLDLMPVNAEIVLAPGIYEWEGERLKICLVQKLEGVTADQRPKNFDVTPESRKVCFSLRRPGTGAKTTEAPARPVQARRSRSPPPRPDGRRLL